jgi:glutathione S-transferase
LTFLDDPECLRLTAINRYLCDTYDKQHKLLPPVGDPKRYEALQWVHAAEGTWALHGISILYVRWNQQDGDVKKTEEALSKNVIADMNYLEEILKKSSGKFIFGDKVSVADTLMHFSAVFILARELGVKFEGYPRITQYIQDCEATSTYKKAVERTGHSL